MNYDQILTNIFITKANQISPKLHYIFRGKNNYDKKYKNVKSYIENRYNDSSSYQETIKRIQYGIDKHPVCPICGKPTLFLGSSTKLFATYCSNSCRGKDPKNNIKWVEGQKQYNLEHYGVEHNFQRNDVKEKRKQTLIEKYGTDKLSDVPEIQQKTKETLKSKYGVESFDEFSKLNWVREQYRSTLFNRYGVETFGKLLTLKEIQEKKNKTQLERGTFNTSKPEEIVFNILSLIYDVKRQYRSDVYPFSCDFYIPILDLYIEYNGTWTHGGHPFDDTNENDLSIVQSWKDKHTKYYDNAIYTWTELDIRKRKVAHDNGLNHIELWNIEDACNFILTTPLKDKLLKNEFNYYKTTDGNLEFVSRTNIIKYFQQDVFFKTEKELFINEKLRNKLIENRKQYLHKNKFTVNELLNGFKISGIHYGYSHFNPLWFKWFIEKYDVKRCYDPCGGWGHRLLGSSDLDLYIYNDLSKQTKENVDRIISYFNIQNTVTYCEDARTFRPKEKFDSMFTCPPYYNLEHYECGDFENLEEYYKFIDSLFECFYKSNAHVFGLVIREDCLEDKWKHKANDKYELKVNKSHLIKTKKYKEYLYIFRK